MDYYLRCFMADLDRWSVLAGNSRKTKVLTSVDVTIYVNSAGGEGAALKSRMSKYRKTSPHPPHNAAPGRGFLDYKIIFLINNILYNYIYIIYIYMLYIYYCYIY